MSRARLPLKASWRFFTVDSLYAASCAGERPSGCPVAATISETDMLVYFAMAFWTASVGSAVATASLMTLGSVSLVGSERMAKLAGVEKIASNSCETSVACCESMAPERVAAPSTAPSIAEEEEGSASPRVSRRSLDMAAVWACLAFPLPPPPVVALSASSIAPLRESLVMRSPANSERRCKVATCTSSSPPASSWRGSTGAEEAGRRRRERPTSGASTRTEGRATGMGRGRRGRG
mmetsp:Transcript_21973/g.60377  ORF Transcript_21973/g.60377 Transcript_21973/m.60377 type:complete len:236 (-) Transcript_21973:35-742(-)